MTTSRLTAAWISAPILLALLLIAGPAAAQDAPRQGGILKAAMSDQPIKELIGTGPFRFVEHRPDRHIRLARFQDSSARVGFKVDLQVLDWATLVQRRNKPELWDLFTTGITFGPDPALTSNLQCDWPGWWCHEEKERLLAELIREGDPRKRRALIERVQAVFYEDVGRIKMGDLFTMYATRDLEGCPGDPFLHFWNAWVAR